MVQAVAIVLVSVTAIGFAVTAHRYGYWKARTIGVLVVALLFGGYFLVIAAGQLL